MFRLKREEILFRKSRKEREIIMRKKIFDSISPNQNMKSQKCKKIIQINLFRKLRIHIGITNRLFSFMINEIHIFQIILNES